MTIFKRVKNKTDHSILNVGYNQITRLRSLGHSSRCSLLPGNNVRAGCSPPLYADGQQPRSSSSFGGRRMASPVGLKSAQWRSRPRRPRSWTRSPSPLSRRRIPIRTHQMWNRKARGKDFGFGPTFVPISLHLFWFRSFISLASNFRRTSVNLVQILRHLQTAVFIMSRFKPFKESVTRPPQQLHLRLNCNRVSWTLNWLHIKITIHRWSATGSTVRRTTSTMCTHLSPQSGITKWHFGHNRTLAVPNLFLTNFVKFLWNHLEVSLKRCLRWV